MACKVTKPYTYKVGKKSILPYEIKKKNLVSSPDIEVTKVGVKKNLYLVTFDETSKLIVMRNYLPSPSIKWRLKQTTGLKKVDASDFRLKICQ